jgi:hypothetical protein
VAGEIAKKCKPDADVDLEDIRFAVMSLLINSGEDYISWMEQIEWDERAKILRDQYVTLSSVDMTQLFTLKFLQEIYK